MIDNFTRDRIFGDPDVAWEVHTGEGVLIADTNAMLLRRSWLARMQQRPAGKQNERNASLSITPSRVPLSLRTRTEPLERDGMPWRQSLCANQNDDASM